VRTKRKKLFKKNHKLLKALEELTVPVSANIYFFILDIFIYMHIYLNIYAFQRKPSVIQAERSPIIVTNMLTVPLHSNRRCGIYKYVSDHIQTLTPKY
jgi:hypothetical protein